MADPSRPTRRALWAPIALWLAVLGLAACSGAPSEQPVATSTVPAGQPSGAPAATHRTAKTPTRIPPTPTKAKTPTPAMRTLEPSATPDTAYPTPLVTRTPAPAAQCPSTSTPSEADLLAVGSWQGTGAYFYADMMADTQEKALAFLNRFGAAHLAVALQPAGKQEGRTYSLQDLTGDGVPEVAFGVDAFYVFGCAGGEYVNLFALASEGFPIPPHIVDIRDINRDAVPEITL